MTYEEIAEQYFLEQDLSKETAHRFVQLGHVKKCEKNTTLLSMGSQTQEVYLILSGIVRGFYITEEGDDITKCFTMEKEWCCVYNLLQEHPSEYWIETLEDSILLAYHTKDLLDMIQTDPAGQRLYAKLFTQAFVLSDERVRSLKDYSATERYVQFQKNYPTLENRIEQRYIASFLGITPSSLSRLKRHL